VEVSEMLQCITWNKIESRDAVWDQNAKTDK